jgi:GTP-binding protein
MNIHKAEFIKSAASQEGFISDSMPQIVFAGRSNVGKSSVINSLLNRRNFARTGATPGKTVHVNYFLIDGQVYFVDLPGYGYAKAAKTEHNRWAKLMEAYFADAGRIALGILIVDARHRPTAGDITMADLFRSTQCRLIVAANKVDKVRNSEKDANMTLISDTLSLNGQARLIPYSAQQGTNRSLLLAEIESL